MDNSKPAEVQAGNAAQSAVAQTPGDPANPGFPGYPGYPAGYPGYAGYPLQSASLNKRRRASRRKKIIKGSIVFLVVIAILGSLVGLSYFVFYMPAPEYYRTALVELVPYLSTEVTGWGYLSPAKKEDISISQPGTIIEANVYQGMVVDEGQVLAVIDSSAIDKTIENINKTIAGFEKDIQGELDAIVKVEEKLAEANSEQIAMAKAATVRAPFSGRILDAPKMTIGEKVKKGDPLGRLVDDRNMKLVLYFSYGYEQEIYIGQKCQVSIPASMAVDTGDGAERVQRISSDGTVTFEVEITLKNPGALTSGLPVTASMTGKNGEVILPSDSGVLEYAQELVLTAESEGPLKTWNIRNYYSVTEGDLLMLLDFTPDTTIEDGYKLTIENHNNSIAAKEASIAEQRVLIDEELAKMDSLTVKSPMTGVITYSNVEMGMKITSSAAGTISVAELKTMTMDASIDERNVRAFKVGMTVEVRTYTMMGYTSVPGTITKIDTKAKQEYGMSSYPVTIQVDNSSGSILDGQSADFAVKTAEAYDALVVPINAVKNTSVGTCVFVRADKAPEGAVTLVKDAHIVPKGFYAVPVECGMSTNTQIVITSGVEVGWTVFTAKTDVKPSPSPSAEDSGSDDPIKDPDGPIDSGPVDGGPIDGGIVDGGIGDGGVIIDDGGIVDGGIIIDDGEIPDGETSGDSSGDNPGGAVVTVPPMVTVPPIVKPMPGGGIVRPIG